MTTLTEAEFSRTELVPKKQSCSHSNNDQGNQFLPIHVAKIRKIRPDATSVSGPFNAGHLSRHANPVPMSQIFRHPHRVTYAECTVGNHIYYARYLYLLEEARGEFFRSAGSSFLQLQEQDFIFPVVEVHLKYKGPARYDDLLTIEVWLTELGKIRVNFGYRILNQNGVTLLEGETWHVCTGLNEKPKRALEELGAKLRPFVKIPDAAAI